MKPLVRMGASLAALTLCLTAYAETPRQTAERAYSKFTRLMQRQDVNGVMAMLHDNYTVTDANGKTYDRDSMAKEVAAMCKQMRNVRGRFELAEVERAGNEIVCWVTMHARFDMKVNGKWVRQSHTEKFIETLVHTPEGWKFASTFVQPD